MIAYRIFEERDGQPCTLFHGIDGTRTLPIGRWVNAIVKPVTNPGKKDEGQLFMSGFHVCRARRDVVQYLTRFKQNRRLVVCRVETGSLRPKAGSKILLANRMRINKSDWKRALRI
jgi:hypothetical protein